MLIWSMCWHIWLGRNAWVFEGKKRDVREVVEKEMRGVMEMEPRNAGEEKDVAPNDTKQGWTAPT